MFIWRLFMCISNNLSICLSTDRSIVRSNINLSICTSILLCSYLPISSFSSRIYMFIPISMNATYIYKYIYIYIYVCVCACACVLCVRFVRVCVCVCVLFNAKSVDGGNDSILRFSFYNIHVIQHLRELNVK